MVIEDHRGDFSKRTRTSSIPACIDADNFTSKCSLAVIVDITNSLNYRSWHPYVSGAVFSSKDALDGAR